MRGRAHAHQNLIIHCDIKPENILVTADGTAKLLDFGIAKLLDAAQAMTLFRPATPAYSSPEQLHGDPMTTASDVYSTGMLGYVVLAGGGPYPSRSGRLDEMVQAILTAEPLRASQVPGLPPQRARKLRGDLDNVLAKAIARDPHRRYASVQQLADDLEAYRRGFPVRARADTVLYRMRKTVARHRFASAAAALGAVSLPVAAAVSTRQARIAERRFDELQALAHAVVFDVNDALSPIPGTTAARKLVAEAALRYFDRLAEDRGSNAALREELAAAYIRIGKVQGGAFLPNLGDTSGAIISFRKALAAVGDSDTAPGPERLRIEAHINIGLLAVDPIQAELRPAGDLLAELRKEGSSRASTLVPVVYAELRRPAHHYLSHERPGHTLQATALVHELYLRLIPQGEGNWNDRGKFIGIAAHVMRQLLVEHARGRGRQKRGGDQQRVPLEDDVAVVEPGESDRWEDLDRALNRLADLDPRQAQIVELRYFGGLTVDEAASVLGVSAKTVKRDWSIARAWLRRELEPRH